MATSRTGFVGLGIMGAPMASNLLCSGVPLSVYNRTASKCEALVAEGAQACNSLRELAAECEVVITMVSDTSDVESVLFGREGIAEWLRPGSALIDMSTISPEATIDFARRLSEKSIAMLDAPVSGGEAGAKAGSLAIMVGGDPAVYQRCLPLFRSMGKNVIYMGDNGNGQKTKMVNQVIGALNLFGHGRRHTSSLRRGLERGRYAQGSGRRSSRILDAVQYWSTDRTGEFRSRVHHPASDKDMRLALELLRHLGIDAPGTELTASLFREAVERGLGESGNHGIYRLWETALGS